MHSIQAAIDIGTNTMLLLVAEISDEKKITKVLADQQTIVRLGEGLSQNGKFCEAAMGRALACFHEYAKICQKLGVNAVKAVATSASRDASNSGEFFETVKKETGISVEIISGEQEARYSFLGGMLAGSDPFKAAILDIGGGSTEFVVANPSPRGEITILGESIDMGSVRATERFPKLKGLEQELKNQWKKLTPELQTHLKTRQWIGVAGTVTTLAAVALKLTSFDAQRIHGLKLSRCDLIDLYESLAIQSVENLAKNPVIGKGRADVIVAGAAILISALEEFEKEEITVSTRGLRYGVLLS